MVSQCYNYKIITLHACEGSVGTGKKKFEKLIIVRASTVNMHGSLLQIDIQGIIYMAGKTALHYTARVTALAVGFRGSRLLVILRQGLPQLRRKLDGSSSSTNRKASCAQRMAFPLLRNEVLERVHIFSCEVPGTSLQACEKWRNQTTLGHTHCSAQCRMMSTSLLSQSIYSVQPLCRVVTATSK